MSLVLLVILSGYGYIGLEAWRAGHPRDVETGTFRGLARDIADLGVTPA